MTQLLPTRSDPGFDRRGFLMGGAAIGAGAMLTACGGKANKAAPRADLVAATFPGTWNEAHREILAPAFERRTGSKVAQAIILGTDQLSRLAASRGGQPPFDVAFLDAPQVGDAVAQGLIAEYPAARSPNFGDLRPEAQDRWGPRVSMQIVGIAYNPNRIKTPPRSWNDLWDPQYKGRVGLTALNSTLGIAFLAEINRLRGGTDSDFRPGFQALRELLPNVGAIGASLGAYSTLWQQEEIDIAPYNFNFVQTLKAKETPVELVIPDSGAIGWYTSIHLVAHAVEPDLAVRYIDTHLDPNVQTAMMKPPYNVIPTNAKVPLSGPITRIAAGFADLAKVRGFDWARINPQRGALIDQFNRAVRL
ncbi:MAG: extracellular solute-binding protein [Sphingobium sp.]